MAFSEIERKRHEKTMAAFQEAHRPPPHLRGKLDLSFRVTKDSIELFELSPHFQEKSRIIEHSVVRARYFKSRDEWSIYWMRADLKWHIYEPQPVATSLAKVLSVVAEDEFGCFFG